MTKKQSHKAGYPTAEITLRFSVSGDEEIHRVIGYGFNQPNLIPEGWIMLEYPDGSVQYMEYKGVFDKIIISPEMEEVREANQKRREAQLALQKNMEDLGRIHRPS